MTENEEKAETAQLLPLPGDPTGGFRPTSTGDFTKRREDYPLGKAWARIARFLDRLEREGKRAQMIDTSALRRRRAIRVA